MFKGRFSKIFCSAILSTSFIMPNFAVNSMGQYVPSPKIDCDNYVPLKNREGKQLLKTTLNLYQQDNNLKIWFHNDQYPLPDIPDDEVYFVCVKDVETNKQICCSYLNLSINSNNKKEYSCDITLPYYCDVLDLKFYKQKKKDIDYNVSEDNFVGQARHFTTANSDFMRGSVTNLTVLNKNGDVGETRESYLIKRLIPNYYALALPRITFRDKIGRVILPDGQEHLLSEEEKYVACNYFRTYMGDKKPHTTTDGLIDRGDGFQLHLPKEVTKFKFQVFRGKVSDNIDDILWQFDIDLNRLS